MCIRDSVVNGSDKVIVGLTNGKKFNAKLIGQDSFTDLAVLKIEGKGPWPKAKLGDSEKSGIMIEDTIVKVGNKNIETASDVIDQISKNGINKKVNILLKRRNKFIQLKVIPTDITNLGKN